MELSRRTFVKGVAVAAAAAAAGSTVACITQPDPGPVTKTKAICRFCGVGCGYVLSAQDGKLTAIEGDTENLSTKGAGCIKGLHLTQILYGEDRFTKPMIRDDKSTKGTPGGLREATWEEAIELVAAKLRDVWKTPVNPAAAAAVPSGKRRMAFWGSGQQPITEGYALHKFWKVGLLSNNIDPNARLCMASAVVAFMNVFQTDEPMGSYTDLDLADVFVTWGANMAEAHPVLFSRLMAHKLSDSAVKHYDITTLHTRTSEAADKVMVFRPGSDLAIANAISNYLIQNDLYDKDFVNDHVQFKEGVENLGHAFLDSYDIDSNAAAALVGSTDGTPIPGKTIDSVTNVPFARFAERMSTYTLEYAAEVSGVSAADIEELAKLFGDPSKKIMSLWTMGVNQHTRGTWMNHCIYNIHLLSGKISKPGSGPFSLTGQPTACGTAREVGLFAHRLPADLLVANEQHRRYSEAIWDLPEGYLDAIKAPGYHTIKIFRELSKGNMDFLWSAANNWAVTLPRLTRFLGKKATFSGIKSCFIVVNEPYPTLSTQYADVIFPVAMWVEREGQYGNAERRTAIFEKAVDPPENCMWDTGVFVHVAKRVLAGETIDGKDAFDHLFGFIWDDAGQNPALPNYKGDLLADQREVNRRLFNEYRIFSNPAENPAALAINNYAPPAGEDPRVDPDTANFAAKTVWGKLKMENKQLAPYDEYIDNTALTWPVREVDGKWLGTTWRFADGKQEDGFDEMGIKMYGEKDENGAVKAKAGGVNFYKSAGNKPSAVFRPYEPPAEQPEDDNGAYPFWFCTGRLLEHWHSGSMTRRVPELDNALPEALLNMNDDDCAKLGIKAGDLVRVTSRHGSFEIKVSNDKRVDPPAGLVFAPFFAEETLINLAVHDYYCPHSKEPDYKKTCVKIEKV